jgi:hypothetical protein
LNKYNEDASFIQSFGKIEKLIIMDSQLYIIPNTVFAPKEYAKYIKIKNSTFYHYSGGPINNFNVPSLIKYLGESSVLETLNLCLNEEKFSSYTQMITQPDIFPKLKHLKVIFFDLKILFN